MANHGYITSRRHFKAEQIEKDLQEINERRFKGYLTIQPDSGCSEKGSWFVSYNDNLYTTGFNIWIESQRKLEHRHTSGWGYYVELVFCEELGAKYDATMSDGGISDRWKPCPEKYPTYRAWLDISHEMYMKRDPTGCLEMIGREMEFAPKELRDR
jgi:hypothetical protein